MTVAELIKKLQTCPQDMTVAVGYGAWRDRQEHKEHSVIIVKEATWVDSNFPFDEEDFEFIMLEEG